MRSLYLILIFFAGCGGHDPIQYQNWAVRVVWNDIYGRTEAPPDIEWIDQSRLTCNVAWNGKVSGFYQPSWYDGPHSDLCMAGMDYPPINKIQLAHPEIWDSFAWSDAFAHELWHQALYYNNPLGYGDPGHNDPGFGPRYGHPHGIVNEASKTLRELGI